MKTLILTVGLPRSGKSTWAKQQHSPIVNPDSIRLALHGEAFIKESEPMVWMMAEYMVKSLFIAGHDFVILDATSITDETRKKWISKDWIVVFEEFKASKEECLKRASDSGTGYLIPVIERMAQYTTFPSDK